MCLIVLIIKTDKLETYNYRMYNVDKTFKSRLICNNRLEWLVLHVIRFSSAKDIVKVKNEA